MLKAVIYVVQCSQRQFNRRRVNEHDKPELVIEGYQEPRADENGKLYIAVVATSVVSKLMQSQRKSQIPARGLEQIREEAEKAEEAYNAACDHLNGVATTRPRHKPRQKLLRR